MTNKNLKIIKIKKVNRKQNWLNKKHLKKKKKLPNTEHWKTIISLNPE